MAILRHTVLSISLLRPGGRGLMVEVWNNTRPSSLAQILTYDNSTPGYNLMWTDMHPIFDPTIALSSRTRGFFVPPTSESYTFYILCDDRCEFYFSHSSRPEDKVNISHHVTIVTIYSNRRVLLTGTLFTFFFHLFSRL